MSLKDQTSRVKRTGECPACKKAANAAFAPFCSQGCKDRDLLKWLGEGYRMAGPPAEFEDSFDHNDQG